jgi:hypothetical protein
MIIYKLFYNIFSQQYVLIHVYNYEIGSIGKQKYKKRNYGSGGMIIV